MKYTSKLHLENQIKASYLIVFRSLRYLALQLYSQQSYLSSHDLIM